MRARFGGSLHISAAPLCWGESAKLGFFSDNVCVCGLACPRESPPLSKRCVSGSLARIWNGWGMDLQFSDAERYLLASGKCSFHTLPIDAPFPENSRRPWLFRGLFGGSRGNFWENPVEFLEKFPESRNAFNSTVSDNGKGKPATNLGSMGTLRWCLSQPSLQGVDLLKNFCHKLRAKFAQNGWYFRFVHHTKGAQNCRKFGADSKVNFGQFYANAPFAMPPS